MQYLVSVIADSTDLATEAEMAAIDAFNERLRAGGHWVFAGGLGGPATVIDNREGAGLVTDGPFTESKEFVAGFWIIEAPGHDAAQALATEGSLHCNRKVELRPFL
ncbi:MAG: YciI family protein [Propionicimonas sp.]|nr:YciI family protein [Propionicimonas sp.]